jgi:serine/threonine-protein kinase
VEWRPCAEDPLLGRIVAIKVLSSELASVEAARLRFRHEGEVAQLLDHHAIVPVFETGVTEGVSWMCMAWIDGETLAERMKRGLMPVAESCEIAATVASALGYAHANGVLHRDVSPRNIMLARDGRTFLLDFGLALVEGATRATRTGAVPGTLVYMPPESLLRTSEDPRSDLYSLAAVLYEMVTGSVRTGDAQDAPRYQKLNTRPRPAGERRPDWPANVERLLARSLERDPARRPSDANEFLNCLREPASGPATRRDGRSAGELLARGDGVVYLGVPAFEVPPDGDDALSELGRALAAGLRPNRLGAAYACPAGRDDAWPRRGRR